MSIHIDMEAPVQLNNFRYSPPINTTKKNSVLIGYNETLCFLFYYIDPSVLLKIHNL